MTNGGLGPAKIPHAWSKNALLPKAQRYVEAMLSCPRNDWRFALWSTLALELVARAALAHISPALLADHKDWNNLYFALRFSPKANKFVPRSHDIGAVFDRLADILPGFDPTLKGFALAHLAKRNEELHSGRTPFDGGSSEWLAQYYETCDVLLKSLGENLELLFGQDEAKAARALIAAAKDQSAKAVGQALEAHKTVWQGKSNAEREQLAQQASVWATRHEGHRVKCPSCGSDAIVTGEAVAPPITDLRENLIIESQSFLPSKFECVACGLKILGLAKIAASGLGQTYTATLTYEVAEYYSELFSQFEDDFNEM